MLFPARALALSMALGLVSAPGLGAALALHEALQLAVSAHPSIAASRSEREAALMQLEGAERQRYPGVVAQSGNDASGNRITTLRLEQALWSGGRISGEIEVANATIRQSEAAMVQSQQDIMLRVVAAFTELGRIQSRYIAAQDNLREHERLVSMIERRVASQVSPASDGIQAQARLSQARAELHQLDAQALRARSALSQATGQTVTAIALPQMPLLDWGGVGEVLDAALDFSPTLRRLGNELEAASATIDVRRSSAYPQVSLRLDRSYGGEANESKIYVALEYQTGAGFAVQSGIREAQARRESIQHQIGAARRDILDSVSGEWADLRALSAQTRDLHAQAENTRAVYESFVRQYAVGRKGWNDVLNAQRELAQARYQLADVETGALRAALRVELLSGRLRADTLGERRFDVLPVSAMPTAPSMAGPSASTDVRVAPAADLIP